MRLYQWPVNASDPMWACALDCATASGMYVLPVIDGNTAWASATDLQTHARFIATQVHIAEAIRPDAADTRSSSCLVAQVANETVVWGLDAQVSRLWWYRIDPHYGTLSVFGESRSTITPLFP